jgi:predicted ATPase
MTPSTGGIRTPDQRLRVFVSSTLKELELERKAVRAAVERLHLAPVMFELGARPHPPRELYRAYLHQSDIFVGIYAERYGWVAPGETVSGLEDEYNLAPEMPKLIYIREPAPGREERLTVLLNRVRDDDRASFKYFSTPGELRRLLEADLATLLAERFDQSRARLLAATPTGPADLADLAGLAVPPEDGVPTGADLLPSPGRLGKVDSGSRAADGARGAGDRERVEMPVPLTRLLGRDRERDEVEALLAEDSVHLVTLLGSGGIGKSRLAIEIANRARQSGRTEVAFVDLSPVRDAALVPNIIAESLGVLDTGDEPLQTKLRTALRERRMLLVLDNFEQVVRAAPFLVNLLSSVPTVKLLVTSRVLLRVSGEHAVEVGPLALPVLPGDITSVRTAASVALFVERARAVKPDFAITPANVSAVVAICLALDGVPLALELAAARIRMLPPAAMLARLDRQLAFLSGGARDLPPRQQTLRGTIEWSAQLLEPDEKALLARLSVFSGGFFLEAVEAVVHGAPTASGDVLTGLEALVDNSLVRERDINGRPRYSMLATVREFATECLEASGTQNLLREAHARYFIHLAKSVEHQLGGAQQREVIAQLNDDRDNLRATALYLLDSSRWSDVADFARSLLLYWWVSGLLGEVRAWLERVLAAGDDLPRITRAIALYFTRSITLWQNRNEWVIPGLTESADDFHAENDPSGEGLALLFLGLAHLADDPPDVARADETLTKSVAIFRSAQDGWGEEMALVTLGRSALLQHKVAEATGHFTTSLAIARQRGDDLGTTIAYQHLGWAQLEEHHTSDARTSFESSLTTAAALGHLEGVAYGLQGLTAIALADREAARAAQLFRASENLRKQTGLRNSTGFSFREKYLAPIVHGGALPDLPEEDSSLSLEETVRFALQH